MMKMHRPSPDLPAPPRRPARLLRFAAPQVFYPLAGRLIPWCAALAALFGLAACWTGFFVAPTDATQGEVYRIIFIHVAAAWMSMFVYLLMAFWSALGLILQTRLSFIMARALAPTGAMFCFVALWSGALWGRPAWGAYWVWDARLTSQLLLFFLYLGYLALTALHADPRRGDRAGALLALVGAINVPVIYFSVTWWNTLHQGASVSLTRAPSMATTMLVAMLLMTLAAWAYTAAIALMRARTLILERDCHAGWVRDLIEPRGIPDSKDARALKQGAA
ncbi:Cytochrome c-type biogenesis protein CcmC [Achromobacter sp. 2789STDY5608615]|nr:Cytochrome c-type biogenesis protein CcmC [Achromobacter sp. 2789STDY5608615]